MSNLISIDGPKNALLHDTFEPILMKKHVDTHEEEHREKERERKKEGESRIACYMSELVAVWI